MSSQTKKKTSKKKQKEERQRIIVFKEKHGNRYFDAATDEKLHAAALKVLRDRFNIGWYYPPASLKEDPMAKIAELEEALKVLKDSDLIKQTKKKIEQTKREIMSRKEQVLEWLTIQKALEESNGKLAYQVLNFRRDYEYEEFDFEYLESADV